MEDYLGKWNRAISLGWNGVGGEQIPRFARNDKTWGVCDTENVCGPETRKPR